MICSRIRRRIDDRLAEIERDESVRLPRAVESGSRAWGFPSPDSDYDVRFLYVRPRDWHLALDKRRDVHPVEDPLDINGMALRLLLRATSRNGWRRLIGRTRPAREGCSPPAPGSAVRRATITCRRSSYRKELAGRETIRPKKYFYPLRPALALRWLRNRAAMPPMDLPTLMAGLGRELREAIDELIARKAKRSETGARVGVRFEELAAAERGGEPAGVGDPAPLNDANAAFRDIVGL